MEESVATDVVARLRARSLFAHLNRRAGVYNVGVRVVIPDGREAIWDNDGAAGLEAMVLRDGVLVGFVPQLPDSEDLDAATIADIIAGTDYDAPVSIGEPAADSSAPGGAVSGTTPSPSPARPSHGASAPPGVPATPPSRPRVGRSWADRLRRRG